MNLILDPKSCVVIRGDKAVRLGPTEFRICTALIDAPADTVQLREIAWGHRKDGGPLSSSCISTRLTHLKDCLEHLGVGIVGSRGFKPRVYQLVDLTGGKQ